MAARHRGHRPHKKFGPTTALDGLDLDRPRGRGPRLPRPQRRREVHHHPHPARPAALRRRHRRPLLGRDPWRDATELHRQLAYVPGDVVLWPNLTGGEVIDLLGRLRGGIDAGKRDKLLEAFELDPTKKGRSYSKGNRQKVALVAALAVRRRRCSSSTSRPPASTR